MPDAPETPAPLTAYLRKLLVFLCLIAFFDGYDLFAISQTLVCAAVTPRLLRTSLD